MKKLQTWKNSFGIIESSKSEIDYLESFNGREVTFEDIVAKSKKKKNVIESSVRV